MTWGSGPNRRWPAGLDMMDRPMEPRVEPIDDLTRFVLDQIRNQESEPRIDQVPQNHDESPVAYRYASKMRADCAGFRRIVALYVEAMAAIKAAEGRREREAEEDRALGLRQAVAAIAEMWDTAPGFRDEWRRRTAAAPPGGRAEPPPA